MSGALAALPEPMLLTGLLESNDNAVVVYGTQGGSWNDNPATRIRAAFDGDTSTYTDMVTTEAWGGVGFVKPVRVTSVRVCLRVGGYSARLAGGLLQGANTSDFSDAVTVHVFKKYPEQGVWTSEDVSQARGLTTSFRYYRIYTDKVLGCGYGFGGLAEVEFVGYDPATLVGVEPAKPTVSKWWLMNGSLGFYSTADANTACLEIQRRWRGEGDDGWTYFATVKPTKTDGTSVRYDQVGKTLRSADFRVRAVNATAVSAWSDVVSLDQPPYLTGTYCGTTTCYSDYRGDKAFDGIPENVTEVTPTATAFAALDFGEVRTLTGLRYMTRCDQRADRSANIVFEVASQPDFSDAVAVHTTSGKGSDFKLRTIYPVVFASPVTGRYARFRSAVGATFNVSEVEFDTNETPWFAPAPTDYFNAAGGGDKTSTYPAVSWFADPDDANAPYVVTLMRAVSPYGPWVPVASGARGKTLFEDVSADVMGRTYYYSVAYGYTRDAETLYGPVAAAPKSYIPRGWLERTSVAPSTLKAGCTLICNGTPWSGKQDRVPAKVFDNSVDTYADLVSPSGCTTHKLGVDFGEPVHVLSVRVAPRKDKTDRLKHVRLYATQKSAADSDWMADANGQAVSTETGDALNSFAWKELTVTNDAAFRSFYLGEVDLTKASWMANISELEYYGYPVNADALGVPSGLTANVYSNHVVLGWNDDACATGWIVERKAADGLWETVGTSGVTAFDDITAGLSGTCAYRVTATNAAEGATSAALDVAMVPTAFEPPWNGDIVVPVETGDGVCGLRWADSETLTNFTFTFRFVRGEGATATRVVPFARQSLVGGAVVEGATSELPSEGRFRIERFRGQITLSLRAANGVWQTLGTAEGGPLAVGSLAVGVRAEGGVDPLAGYSFSDAVLAKRMPGMVVIVR